MNLRLTQIAITGLLVAAFIGGAGYWVVAERQRVAEKYRIAEQTRVDRWIAEQKRSLTSGELDEIYFYSTSDTDHLIAEFSGMSEIKGLGFELTDLSNEGLRHVAVLPELQELVIYGYRDANGSWLELLRGNPTLRVLELVNTDVADSDLDILTTLPQLVELELFYEAHHAAKLTDSALEHLRRLDHLETLIISGGWMSEEALLELRDAMPACKIETNTRH